MPAQAASSAVLGVLSDTHGELPSAVLRVFAGVDMIVHAGDVGRERILHELSRVAPVLAVCGNTDLPYPTWVLRRQASSTVAGVRVAVSHTPTPAFRSIEAPAVVVTGHTHRPEVWERDGVLHVNPGSAVDNRARGARGTVAIVSVDSGALSARIVTVG